jgi:hypothetical protein
MPTEKPAQTDKRRVTMRSIRLAANGATITEECVDYVPSRILDAYVADARTRWQMVEVGDFDHGPGGPDGDTDHTAHLKDLTEEGLAAAHEEHLSRLIEAGEPLLDPVDAPSPVVMTVAEQA